MLRDRFSVEVVDTDEALGFSENAAYVVVDRLKGTNVSDLFDELEPAMEALVDIEETIGYSQLWFCDCVGGIHGNCGYWELDHP
jgi:hypothetical protein